MKRSIIMATTAVSIAFGAASTATAGGGVFDSLDPCIEARDSFRDQRHAILAAYDVDIAAADSANFTPEYRKAWMKAKKEQLRSYFDANEASRLTKWGVTNLDAAYDDWFSDQLGQISANELNDIINVHYRQELKQVRIEEKAMTQAELDRQKNELHGQCKMDVGNQVLRGTLTAIMTPFDWAGSNWEAAKNESGELSKITRATIGVSLDDIMKKGPLGGENSEARKLVNSIAGGKNSAVRQGLRAIDPSNLFR